MPDQAFQLGAIVRLKSGGPKMTVASYGQYGHDEEKKYLCKWFDDKHKPFQDTFGESELELVPDKGGFMFEVVR
jgi:uncharacterized protein YodC (DUF2158 family)